MKSPPNRIALRFGAAAALCCALVSQSASAAPIAYDGFDYATGSLAGQGGGTGDWKSSLRIRVEEAPGR